MKRAFIISISLIGGAWFGLLMHKNPGYVLLSYQHTTIESTLWFALLFLLLSFFAIKLLLRSSLGIITAPRRAASWFEHRKKSKRQACTLKGIQYLIQGNWALAEKKLNQLTQHDQHYLINLLFAAKAASRNGATHKRDDYLKKAFDHAPEERLAISLTQAQLQIEHCQFEQALATLKQLHQQNPQHKWITTQLAKLYYHLHEWHNLASLIPFLKRHHCIDTKTLCQMEISAYSDLYQAASDLKSLQNYWHDTSREAQSNAQLLLAYLKQLIAFNQQHQTAKLLKKQLNKFWMPELLTLYSFLAKENPTGVLKTLLYWQKTHASCPSLLCQIGLCYQQQDLNGKAKEALHQAVQLDNKHCPAWIALAEIADKGGDLRQANDYLKHGLTTASLED